MVSHRPLEYPSDTCQWIRRMIEEMSVIFTAESAGEIVANNKRACQLLWLSQRPYVGAERWHITGGPGPSQAAIQRGLEADLLPGAGGCLVSCRQ